MTESLLVATGYEVPVVSNLTPYGNGERVFPDKDIQIEGTRPSAFQLFTPRLGVIVPECRQIGVEKSKVSAAEVTNPGRCRAEFIRPQE
jgi:hypothetical protein